MRRVNLTVWSLACAVLFACGCSKLTYENWRTIDVGTASPEAVEATLGDPWKKIDDTWIYNDTDKNVTARIQFSKNRVVGKEWADADRGLETVGEQPDEPGEAREIHIQEVK